MQSAEDKASAIASVLWLLPSHYTCLRIGRSGVTFAKELADQGEWRIALLPEFDGWPIEQLESWFREQRRLSAKYRLWAVGLAAQKCERDYPHWWMATWCLHGEIPPFCEYEPSNAQEWAKEGLRYMAEDVPGDVPWFQEAVVQARPGQRRNKRTEIAHMLEAGYSWKAIARDVQVSKRDIKAVKREMVRA